MRRKGMYIVMTVILLLEIITFKSDVWCPFFGMDATEAEMDEAYNEYCRAVGIPEIKPYDGEPYNPNSSKPVHKHSYEEKVIKESTCSEEGSATYTCSCGDTYTKELPTKEHTFKDTVITPATCKKEGKMHRVCSVCGYEEDKVIPIDAEAHNFVEEYLDTPSCEVGGTAIKKCSECGYVSEKYDVEPLGHAYEIAIKVEPTCTEKGYTTYMCYRDEFCRDTYDEETDALGHDEGEWIVDKEPSTFFNGARHTECKRCGEVLQNEVLASTYPTYFLYIGIGILVAIAVILSVVLIKKKKKDK